MTTGPQDPVRVQLTAICDRLLPAEAITPEQRQELLAQLEQVLLSAKLEALAEFAAGAGHEINNPVATIAGRAQLLTAGETNPERRHALEIIGGQALRIRDMIGDVMLFARPPIPRVARHALLELVTQAVASQAELKRRHSAVVTIEVAADATIDADRTQLLVVLSSLLRNSLEAASQPGIQVRVSARDEVRNDVAGIIVAVQDNGPGLSESAREHAFDPFFSGRQAGRGLGFGLSKCWRILQLHAGDIQFRPIVPGTIIETWWPYKDSQLPTGAQ